MAGETPALPYFSFGPHRLESLCHQLVTFRNRNNTIVTIKQRKPGLPAPLLRKRRGFWKFPGFPQATKPRPVLPREQGLGDVRDGAAFDNYSANVSGSVAASSGNAQAPVMPANLPGLPLPGGQSSYPADPPGGPSSKRPAPKPSSGRPLLRLTCQLSDNHSRRKNKVLLGNKNRSQAGAWERVSG